MHIPPGPYLQSTYLQSWVSLLKGVLWSLELLLPTILSTRELTIPYPTNPCPPPVVAVNSWEFICKYSAPSACCWDSAMHVLHDFQHSPETFSFQALRGPWMDNTLFVGCFLHLLHFPTPPQVFPGVPPSKSTCGTSLPSAGFWRNHNPDAPCIIFFGPLTKYQALQDLKQKFIF